MSIQYVFIASMFRLINPHFMKNGYDYIKNTQHPWQLLQLWFFDFPFLCHMGEAAHPSDEHMSHADADTQSSHKARKSSTSVTVQDRPRQRAANICVVTRHAAGRGYTTSKDGLQMTRRKCNLKCKMKQRQKQETRRIKSQTHCYATPLHFGTNSYFSNFQTLIALFTELFLAKVIVPWIFATNTCLFWFDPHAWCRHIGEGLPWRATVLSQDHDLRGRKWERVTHSLGPL